MFSCAPIIESECFAEGERLIWGIIRFRIMKVQKEQLRRMVGDFNWMYSRRMSYRFLFFLPFALLIVFPGGSLAGEKSTYCNIAESAIHQASDIRGLRQKRKVPCYVHNREQVKKYLLHAKENVFLQGRRRRPVATAIP